MDRVGSPHTPSAMTGRRTGEPARQDDARGGGASRPRIGVIYNPRSHRNKGVDLDCSGEGAVAVEQPRTHDEIASALAGFAQAGIDFLIINGGDGTVRDVLTMGQGVFGENWPAIAVLPKGKTNALNVDLGAPADWSLADAIAAYANGRRLKRRPLAVDGPMDGDPMLGFIFGAGAFTLGISRGQDAHRMGFFDSLAVGATSAWGIAQGVIGRDTSPWRRPSTMRIAVEPGAQAVPHVVPGEEDTRYIMIASPLDRLPLGIKLFGKAQAPIRMAVLDRPRRRIMASLPAILAGWRPRWLEKAGLHMVGGEGFTLEAGEPVILDGEAFAPGTYRVMPGPELTFVTI